MLGKNCHVMYLSILQSNHFHTAYLRSHGGGGGGKRGHLPTPICSGTTGYIREKNQTMAQCRPHPHAPPPQHATAVAVIVTRSREPLVIERGHRDRRRRSVQAVHMHRNGVSVHSSNPCPVCLPGVNELTSKKQLTRTMLHRHTLFTEIAPRTLLVPVS